VELTSGARRWLIAGGLLLTTILFVLLARSLRRDRVEGHAFDIPTGDNRIIVEVLNGSGRNGLARLGARRLRRHGIDVVLFGNAISLVDSTQVILRRGDRIRAGRVKDALGVGRIRETPDSLPLVDVTVILGPDFTPDEDGRP
jgi:LytR cell envelope-related transcriptional attenuator